MANYDIVCLTRVALSVEFSNEDNCLCNKSASVTVIESNVCHRQVTEYLIVTDNS